ncbi:MAG: aldehyde dehydrogenase family protein, partial [Chitinophagaceae bacterium]
MSTPQVLDQLAAMRQNFQSGITRPFSFRKEQIQKLKQAVLHHEKELYEALFSDLKKSPEETWVTETGFLLSEINHTLNNLRRWMQPDRTATNLLNLPSSSYVLKEPLGTVLIIGPWNYPLQLLFIPLVGALAAGNCVVLKPSEFAPATSAVMKKIIEENFSPDYVFFVEG